MSTRATRIGPSRAKNPDAMVHHYPGDEGRITEFKTLDSGTVGSAMRNMKAASHQVPPDSKVVIDGRGSQLTEADAREAYRRAASSPPEEAAAPETAAPPEIAAKVHVILGNVPEVRCRRGNGQTVSIPEQSRIAIRCFIYLTHRIAIRLCSGMLTVWPLPMVIRTAGTLPRMTCTFAAISGGAAVSGAAASSGGGLVALR